MNTEVEIGIYTHRWSQLQVRAVESIARHTKTEQYSVLITQHPGNCHQNMNRVWERFTAPYVVLMDEDVVVLQDDWLRPLLWALDEYPTLGVVGCAETKVAPENASAKPVGNTPYDIRSVNWVPAYVMAFKRERVSFLRFDEKIPGDAGMTDVDACLQISSMGFGIGLSSDVTVCHPQRDDDYLRDAEQRPRTSKYDAWYPEQRSYMQSKWGDRFISLETTRREEI